MELLDLGYVNHFLQVGRFQKGQLLKESRSVHLKKFHCIYTQFSYLVFRPDVLPRDAWDTHFSMVTLLCDNLSFLLRSSKTFLLSVLIAQAYPAFKKIGFLLTGWKVCWGEMLFIIRPNCLLIYEISCFHLSWLQCMPICHALVSCKGSQSLLHKS